MRSRSQSRYQAAPLRSVQQVRTHLEELGVAAEFSRTVAERVTPLVLDLHDEAYTAVLQAVAASYGVHNDDLEKLGRRAHDAAQLQRLMRGFAGELRKLDEALRTLNAYVTRMRTRSAPPSSRTLH
jgi:hypothetical protein